MRTLVSIILAAMLLAAGATAAEFPEPRITELNGEPFLDLPQELRAELAARLPDFHMFSNGDFLPSIQAALPALRTQGVQLLWAVVGDFDGNGLGDAILSGHSHEKATLVLVFTKADAYEFHIYQNHPFNPHEWYGVGDGKVEYGLWGYLRKMPRGTITSPYEEQPVELENDAFESVAWGKASVLLYWKGGELKRFITSD